MKKILSVLTLTAAATALCCPSVFAAEIMHSAELGAGISLVFAIPFVGMLLCIAICPLVIPEKWEKWRWLFVLFWSLLFLIPFALTYNVPTMVDQLLESLVGDYLTFIVLLFGLFCVAGNICLEGDLAGTPKTNVLLLLIGTALASWIGTTGASMVMIRPILRANRWRSKCVQTVVFFIFLVSNIGGCLTPIGDPPLLMGFMRGVPFTWELQHLLPIMALNVVVLLAIADGGKPYYDAQTAQRIAGMEIPCFACAPDRLPELLERVLKKQDLAEFAARHSGKQGLAQ